MHTGQSPPSINTVQNSLGLSNVDHKYSINNIISSDQDELIAAEALGVLGPSL
jgi:hypothetical protein